MDAGIKKMIVVPYADVFGVKEDGQDRLIAIRNTKKQAQEVADMLNQKNRPVNYNPQKEFTQKELFFMWFCETFDQRTGRLPLKGKWYSDFKKEHDYEPKKHIDELPKFYKWFCETNLDHLRSYDVIVKTYFSKKK